LQPFAASVGHGAALEGAAYRTRCVGLGGLDVRSLLALGTSGDVKRYALTFLERLEATGVDCRVMREEILSTVFRGDEAKTFCVVEPLNCSVCHDASYFHKAIFRH